MWYQIEALNRGGSFMYSFSSFSGCHAWQQESRIFLKREKMDIFVICVILKVSFTPSGHTQGLQYGYWKLPSSFFLINSYQYFFI